LRTPQTEKEWREAVDAAAGALAIESARLYGLVTGGPTVDVLRCEAILKEGARLGFEPPADAGERYARELLASARVSDTTGSPAFPPADA
jgi:hypothetical protein